MFGVVTVILFLFLTVTELPRGRGYEFTMAFDSELFDHAFIPRPARGEIGHHFCAAYQ